MSLRLLSCLAAAALLAVPAVSHAALAVGAKAPDFSTKGALAGKEFNLRLSDQLKRGPVVLYFFPAAFTQGCTLETHEFAENVDEFRASGASVIGMSADPIDKLSKFSREACRDKFPVATATPAVISGFDVKMPTAPVTNRTSYVIAPNGSVIYVHSDLNYRDHVKNTLAAVRDWRAKQK